MSIFLSFAILGLVIFLIAAATRPPEKQAEEGRTSISRFFEDPVPPKLVSTAAGEAKQPTFFAATQAQISKILPSDPLARWVATVAVAAAGLTIPFVWFAWDALRKAESPETPFLEFLGSRYVGSAAFGVIFGILLGYWLSSVLFRQREESPSYAEIVAGVLMAILLVIGLAGQDALSTIFTRLNSVEIGGAKFGFAESGGLAKSPTALANNGAPTPPDQSYGLKALLQLSDTIGRDAHYARLLARDSSDKGLADRLFKELSEVQLNAAATIKPLAECLNAYVTETGDDGRVGRLLEDVAAHLRGYVRNHEPSKPPPPRWEVTFWKGASQVLAEAPAASCEGLNKMLNGSQGDLLKPLETSAWRERPYLSISYASMLAYEHQYVAAIASLDQWLANHEKTNPTSEEEKVKSKVFKLRVRILIATYVEEWLRGTYGIQTRAVLTYHIGNLTNLIHEVDRDFDLVVGNVLSQMTLSRSPMIDSQFARAPADDGICSIPNLVEQSDGSKPTLSDSGLKLMLIRALISAKLMWISVALDHPDYLQKFANQAEARADELLRLDLSCLQKLDPEGIAIKRAESLDAFARVKLANRTGTETLRAMLNRDKTRQDLELALAAISLGQEIIRKVDAEKKKIGFLATIESAQSDDTSDALKRTEKRLRGLLE